ncbi:MAG: ornithine carbamoyltransferase [Clostridiales Family XIII bacterium]|jgi:ornithine carbamoyltransferase|nr:ornithine carbamoyltransferase [Clostridiales Family XIII bacterium]
MTINLKGRSFLSLKDFSGEEIRYLLDLSKDLKAKRKRGEPGTSLRGKSILLLFEKTSSRTRCSFEVAAIEEGGYATYIAPGSSQFGKKESIADSAQIFARYYHGIEYRGYAQKVVEDLAKYSGIPVWNGLTDDEHPTQILADLLTIEENISKPLSEVKVVFCGDIRNNMSYSWMYGCAKLGMHYVAYGPPELAPSQPVLDQAREIAEGTGAVIEWGSDPSLLAGADVVYTDVWASMGEEDQIPERARLLKPYKVTEELMAATGNPDVVFLHCLPAFHDFDTALAAEQKELGHDIREVDDKVFKSKASKVFDEAENRLHTIKAILVATLGD